VSRQVELNLKIKALEADRERLRARL
jgi:hypothetical protein